MRIFFKDEVQEREVKECEDGQGVMFWSCLGERKNCLNHSLIVLSDFKSDRELYIGL
ncbi:hypothetical protein KSU1_B0278 [Candidatus Jettenia caeni]|uniref:Uncharacterized protein n=1 Tax=Candidatus Jettenia caeni TaxID=247490 RepID=I3IHE0_9BACT|nr:hypothetical protein KSU1_B0278 [Candidatus Jettenia caeni]